MKKEFVKVNSMEFTKAGKPILFRGMGIGSWLNMEHFMLGIPTPDNQIRKTVKEVFGKRRQMVFLTVLSVALSAIQTLHF